MDYNFTDKVVLVTGSSSGIGAATALQYAKYGAKVVITGRSQTKLDAVYRKLIELGISADKVLLVRGEISDDGDVRRLVDKTLEKFGTVDILINNAGVAPFRPMETITERQFDDIMDVNVRAAFYITQLVSGELIKNKGSVINISSIAGVRPAPGDLTVYSISKHGNLQFTKALALELGPKGVRVNAVSPGTVAETDIWYGQGSAEEAYGNQKGVDKMFEFSKKRYDLGRLPVLNDVVQTIVMLTSEKASFSTGVNIRVDGGVCCKGPVKPNAPKNA